MKKLLLFAAVLFLPLAAFAQGRVNFANARNLIQTNNQPYSPLGPASLSASPLRIGLFIGPVGESNPQNLTLALNNIDGRPAWATNQPSPFAGHFNGGNNFEIQGNAGTPISFQIRAWALPYITYNEALTAFNLGLPNVFNGVSTIGTVTPSIDVTPTPNLFGTAPGQISSFTVTSIIIPEPSSITLGLLGVGILTFFRRRN